MNRISDLLKKIRISTNELEGSAHWETEDLLGDRHVAVISWSENNLKIEKSVDMNNTLEPSFCVQWEVSPKGRLLLKDFSGLPSQSTSNEAFQYVRQSLETGTAPVVLTPVLNQKGLAL